MVFLHLIQFTISTLLLSKFVYICFLPLQLKVNLMTRVKSFQPEKIMSEMLQKIKK